MYAFVYIYKRINLSLATRVHAPIYVNSFKYGLKSLCVCAFFLVVMRCGSGACRSCGIGYDGNVRNY